MKHYLREVDLFQYWHVIHLPFSIIMYPITWVIIFLREMMMKSPVTIVDMDIPK